MLRIALIGCGKIADSHASAIAIVPGAQLVAAVDREVLMARQLSERYKIKGIYDDTASMLRTERPDVVHILTPPQSHYELGILCLDAGCHVYLEKPFTTNGEEAEAILHYAAKRKLKVTVGTDEQFSHVAISMRSLVRNGYLGGPPVHMEVYYGYDLGDEKYARVFLANRDHWVRSLPGHFMHNIIPHGIAKIVEFLNGKQIRVTGRGFNSRFLKKLGEAELIDELRVILEDERGTTAYCTLSSQMRPLLREFRLYGPRNGLVVDQEHHALIRVPGRSYLSYAEKFLPLWFYSNEYRRAIRANARLFLNRNFHLKAGQERLIEMFYRSISDGTAPPIPYREIVLTTKITDAVFVRTAQPDRIISRTIELPSQDF